ncbi:hypothetical protein T4D_769 [Trichinella pseudospiralis]|uniref:Uncharacterized protein n=1 Tax=Trichinella pseudospiralis TaxID=6337 RepID=A0A0V1CT10_TRIPS|nr:hypothetical protein T4D_11196 [Trichinella pseudospiralis]KRY52140.1 hypothetical protein T4D_4266 [Trichinella pseudospiralis]KRY61720.1 hypothetical protein T4D_8575 [Trichinella pseudospiralis]KRY62852.1 hypothetical protein T4D_8838 [Trichinella pseudospiralis]KRY64414.1 hypothetical protein T4D_769 [Trichinella pseudospiralis]
MNAYTSSVLTNLTAMKKSSPNSVPKSTDIY